LEEASPGGGDVKERLKEPLGVAAGSEGRKGAAEVCEVVVDYYAVCRVQGIEPATMWEEPAACMPAIQWKILGGGFFLVWIDLK
jgi:hypothetical protein